MKEKETIPNLWVLFITTTLLVITCSPLTQSRPVPSMEPIHQVNKGVTILN